MNPETPQKPPAESEVSLTALLLGELPHDQAAGLHQKLTQDAQLAALYERLKHTINLVRETVTTPAAQATEPLLPLRLEERRRQKLLEHFKTVAPKEFAPPRRRGMRWLIRAGIAAGLVGIAGVLLLPSLARRMDVANQLGEGGGEYFGLRTLSQSKRAASPAPSAPMAASVEKSAYAAQNLRQLQIAGGASDLRRPAAVAAPAVEPPKPAESAGTAIVLPKSGQADEANTMARVRYGLQPESAAAAKTRGFDDDSSGRAGGAGGVGAYGGFAAGTRGRAAERGEGQPTKGAVSVDFFSQQEALGAKDTTVTLGEGVAQTEAFRRRYSATTAAASPDLALKLESRPANAPASPASVPSPVTGSLAEDRLGALPPAPEESVPGPAVGGTKDAPAAGVEVAKVPLQLLYDDTAGNLVEGLRSPVASPQPAEVAKGEDILRRADAAWSDASKKVFDAPAVKGRFAAGTELKAAKEPEPQITLQGITTLNKPSAQGPALGFALRPDKTARAGEQADRSVEASKLVHAFPSDVQNLNYQWHLDASAQHGLANAEGEKVPVMGDVPAAGRFFRSESDQAGNWDIAKAGIPATPALDVPQEGAVVNSIAAGQRLPERGTLANDGKSTKLPARSPIELYYERLPSQQVPRPAIRGGRAQDEVSAGAMRIKAEEKVNSVELAGNPDTVSLIFAQRREGVQIADSLAGTPNALVSTERLRDLDRQSVEAKGKKLYSANVVGYYDAARTATNAIVASATETFPHYGSSIVLPSAEGDTRLALTDSSGSDQKREQLREATRNLEELQRFRQILGTKIASEGIDASLPKSTMVEVVDKAVPQSAESPTLGERFRSGLGGKVERHARIKVERDQSDITGLADRQQEHAYDPYFVQTEFEAMQSEAVLGKVIDNLNLKEEWGKKQGGGQLTKEEALGRLKKSLDLKAVPNTSLLDVGVKSDSPDEAARIANAVAEAYRDQRLEQRKESSQAGIKALEEGYQAQEAKVHLAQANVDRLRKELNVSDAMAVADGPSPLITADTLRKLESVRIEGQVEYVRQQTLLGKVKELRQNVGSEGLAEALPSAAVDSLLSSLAEQSTLAKQRLETLQKERGPQDAEVLKSKANVEDLQRKIANRVDGVIAGMEARTASLKQSVIELEKEVAKATTNDTMSAAQSRPYFEAKRNLEELQRFRKIMEDKIAAEKSHIEKAAQAKQADLAPPKPAAPAPVPQPEVQASDNRFSTFSLNVSDVSFKLAAASLEKGAMPEAASVRSEEFINALDYRDPEPPPGVPVAFAWERAQYPFAQNRDLLRFSIKTAALGRQAGCPLNLVLLLDNSGSMERADRVQIIREALRVLAAQLQPQDKFSVVTFARTARLWVDGVPGNQAAQAAEEVGSLTPQGGTNLGDAMDLAYQTALRHYLANGVNRVVLLTDGAANLGNVDPEALKQKVEANRKQGIALDCFGIGWEGYNDDLLEVLSRNGDGRYGFVNTPEEAATEFAGQLAGALHVAASDVKVQVEFNPARVTAYRQIGYAKHQLTKEQFRDNTVDAAEIAAAESGNALYVIAVNPNGEGPLATVRVRYKVPGTTDYHEHEWPVPYTGNAVVLDQASPALRLAAAASAFSEWLASSPYAGEVTPDRLLGYLTGVPEVYGADARPKKLEWMIRQAKSIAGK